VENSTGFSPAVAELLAVGRLNPLGPGTPNEAVRARLDGLRVDMAFAPEVVRDRDMAAACLAGLWLRHDFLDESHRISQDVDTPTGSYWHALMHRRELDFGNSAYWFRRVGRHPVFEVVQPAAAELARAANLEPAACFLVGQTTWDPFAFVHLCEEAVAGRARCELLCRQIQQREWEILFDFCYRRATGAADA
jgi:hypothetical protein